MGTLDRYQKKGGFVQLVSLIESADPDKSKKFLNLIEQESQPWEKAIREKSLTLEKIVTFDSRVLSDPLEGLPHSVIAVAICKESENIKQKLFEALSPVFLNKVENALKDNTDPRPGDIIACQIRIIEVIRKAMNEGRIKISQIPESLQIPEGLEAQLTKASWTETLKAKTVDSDSPLTQESLSPSASVSGGAPSPELTKKIHLLLEENQILKTQISQLERKINEIKKLVN